MSLVYLNLVLSKSFDIFYNRLHLDMDKLGSVYVLNSLADKCMHRYIIILTLNQVLATDQSCRFRRDKK